MTDNGVLSFQVDVLYTDVSDDVSCDGLATLVIDSSWCNGGKYKGKGIGR